MPRGKGIYDDEGRDDERDERKGGRRGRTDPAREGGMPTGEETPDVADTGGEPTA